MGGSSSSSTNQSGTLDQMQYGGDATNVTGIDKYQQQFGKDYSGLMDKYRGQLASPAKYAAGTMFSNMLDPIVAAQMSKGYGANMANQATSNRQLATQLSRPGAGINTALLAALQRQGSMATAGANNQLVPAALEAQRGFDLQRNQMINANNASIIAQRGQGMAEIGQGGNLIQLLNQMAQTSAGKQQLRATKENQANTGTAVTNSSKSLF